ncbi:MAG TPA: excinuclease ABC subunit UvrA [Verrucomicrobiales bacterium]|nr:excinuclease ABC subunit UvrA [Verrucomicrobiales bacterium]
MTEWISIRGARQHNLQNIDVRIPRRRLVVVTGVSGSGKSSLAFSTLYAEGQRRYVESLSTHARQFLDQVEPPDVDAIEGLSPAIALEQRPAGSNPRSTVATITEILDYARILFAAAGQPHDPTTGERVSRQTPQQIVDRILALPPGSKAVILAPIDWMRGEKIPHLCERLRRDGLVRVRIDGKLFELDDQEQLAKFRAPASTPIEAVIDRITVREGVAARLTDSVEAALRRGNRRVRFLLSEPEGADWRLEEATTAFSNPSTGFHLPDLSPKHFSFNSHLGACPDCHGLGCRTDFDPLRFLARPDLPLLAGGLRGWWPASGKVRSALNQQILALAQRFRTDLSRRCESLPSDFIEALLHGDSETAWPGLISQAERLQQTTRSASTRRLLQSLTSERPCSACNGRRLRPEILAVTLTDTQGASQGIGEFSALRIAEARAWISSLVLPAALRDPLTDIQNEISERLRFLERVGLGYLSLDRKTVTLSGGETQRIRLATQLGGRLSGVIYVLDEPSIGLHPRDHERLLETLRELRDLGNTVIVVEHDLATILAADHVIDMGPGAGPQGGSIVAEGSPAEIAAHPASLTGRYLRQEYAIAVPGRRRQAKGWLRVLGARQHNLRDIDAAFPLGCFTCVTGVSGSGKSTLVDDILRPALAQRIHGSREMPGVHRALEGAEAVDKIIVIDQSPIGRSPRSNPATYVGAFDLLRALFARLPAARLRGYNPSRFSFNLPGGRCEQCRGEGAIRIDMHFLHDVFVPCDACRGSRYNRETLQVAYRGRNIAEILDASIHDAARLFERIPRIYEKLRPLEQVGLGYLKLGQPANTLSGGEAQRVRIAAELARRDTGHTVYLLDEPTTGLHLHDIGTLLEVLQRLAGAGNTLITVEHHPDFIRCADWVIDLGPEGGEGGGSIVAQGTPEEVAASPSSHTGRFLARPAIRH